MSIRYDIVDNAKKDLGYTEGANNDTKFGDWYGLPNQPWCAMAVSKWISDRGVSKETVKPFASCTTGYNWFRNKGQVRARGYYPKPGDIIFFIWEQGEPTPDHVGIVEYTDQGVVHTIEGNRSNQVQRYEYPVNDWRIYGYAVPVYEDDIQEENKEEIVNNEEEEDMVEYANGSTIEPVFETSAFTKEIGSLNKWEKCKGKKIADGVYLVLYKVDGTNNYKSGFVRYNGGIK